MKLPIVILRRRTVDELRHRIERLTKQRDDMQAQLDKIDMHQVAARLYEGRARAIDAQRRLLHEHEKRQ